ncbi:MAG: amidohydrolase family protein, partial [Bacteroidota bacterium]
ERLGLTYFSNPNNKPDSGWSKKQLQRNADNFKAFMVLAKKVYDKGIKIRIGTDCPNGGKAALSEQVLLAQYGFSIPSIIQISTINGATALGMENKYGSVEKGKKADLIIYDNNPFDNYNNFLSGRTVIKDGKVHSYSTTK